MHFSITFADNMTGNIKNYSYVCNTIIAILPLTGHVTLTANNNQCVFLFDSFPIKRLYLPSQTVNG